MPLPAPALLVGLLAVLGLLLQKKKATAVVQGGIKTFAGFLILTGGAGILLGNLGSLGEAAIIAGILGFLLLVLLANAVMKTESAPQEATQA